MSLQMPIYVSSAARRRMAPRRALGVVAVASLAAGVALAAAGTAAGWWTPLVSLGASVLLLRAMVQR